MQLSPEPGDRILDVGCGTGSLAIMIKQQQPSASVVGIDPDPNILKRAAAKAAEAGLDIEWREGFARDAASVAGTFDKAVSALVFHQVPGVEKVAGVEAMLNAVRSHGEVHIADYCRQDEWLMRQLFRVVQALDGKANTQANVEGAIETILGGVSGAVLQRVVRTLTGAISLFRVIKG